MENKILGLHHITAIAGDPQQNFDFYTKVLGLRMIKKTVNFDDPKTYHFYFGDKVGSPGTILTFFPWPRVRQGRAGAGMATEIGFSVPSESLQFWKQRFKEFNVPHGEIFQKLEEDYLPFTDPDGLNLELLVSKTEDERVPWSQIIPENFAIKGFFNVTLTLNDVQPTAAILTDIFGYKFVGQEKDLYRFRTDTVKNAAVVDLLEKPNAEKGLNAGGTNHHVAFRVKNEEILMAFRERVIKQGLHITEKINRDYFFSLYFREPGGVLFEIATNNPGFTKDETVDELGSKLQLPDQYKNSREQIEKVLPELKT